MKKRIFNMVVAVAAAMSLSVCAFAEAADPGVSDPGASGSSGFTIPGWSGLGVPGQSDAIVGVTLGTGLAEFGSDQGVKISGPGAAFGEPGDEVFLAVSLLNPVPADVAADVAEDVEYELSSYRPKLVTDKLDVQVVMSLEFYKKTGDEFKQIHPKGEMTVNVAKPNGDTNIVAHVKDDGTYEWLEPTTVGQVVTFTANSFSDYYILDIDQLVADTLLDEDDRNNYPGVDPENPIPGGDPVTTTTPAAEVTTTPAAEVTTTPAAEVTTTKAPEVTTTKEETATTTTTTKAPSGGNTVNTPDDGNGNNNVGNDGNGNGPDKNQATGVVLAVIPAAIAASAVIISKKRK